MDILKPGGCLVNVVPHFTRLNALVSQGSSANVVPPYHVSLFSEVSLSALLSRIDGSRDVLVQQYGGPSFQIFDHVPFGDHWDISIPTTEEPVPQSIQIKPYTPSENKALNALSGLEKELAEYFADADGRLFLVSYIWKAD
jgi:hypothetical protein